MARGRVRVGAKAAARRAAGGKLAAGRNSATREALSVERAFVMARNKGWCEIGELAAPCGRVGGLAVVARATDFAHVVARSAGGSDDHWNALALCRKHHRQMEGPFVKGRLVVTRVTVNRVRGFDWEIATAADKHAYRRGAFVTWAAGFIRAETSATGTVVAESELS